MNIERPTVELISRYIKEWDTTNHYQTYDVALRDLFHHHYPDNSDLNSVLIKLVALNDFYKTNVYEIYEVAQYYLTCNIDERLRRNDYQLVNDLAKRGTLKKRYYSLATKYCSFHNPDHFPIYDSYVEKMLVAFKKNGYLPSIQFNKEDLKDYTKFQQIMINFKKLYDFGQFSLRDLDKFVWAMGKDKFRKKAKMVK